MHLLLSYLRSKFLPREFLGGVASAWLTLFRLFEPIGLISPFPMLNNATEPCLASRAGLKDIQRQFALLGCSLASYGQLAPHYCSRNSNLLFYMCSMDST
jgi:hypothetical protein